MGIEPQYQLIRDFLMIEVPREIQAVLDRGGINDLDWKWLCQECNDDPDDCRPINVLMRADSYLLHPKNLEVFERSLLILRKIITIMAFAPLGIRLWGFHFSIDIPGFVEDDGSSEA